MACGADSLSPTVFTDSTVQVAGEEVRMSGDSRRAAARPERLTELLEPVVSAAGLELESVRVGRAGRRSLLRVVVDADQGVDTDRIAQVSRAVAAEVDASDVMGPAPYTLEVSSPGVDRPLTEPRHWRRASGRLVQAPLRDSAGRLSGQANSALTAGAASPTAGTVRGRVITAGPGGVTLDVGGERREFGYADLGPGQIQVEFGKLAGGAEDSAPDGGGPAAEGESDGH
jgi:ribosome maturation factor RimP